jgi:hypothetical protein
MLSSSVFWLLKLNILSTPALRRGFRTEMLATSCSSIFKLFSPPPRSSCHLVLKMCQFNNLKEVSKFTWFYLFSFSAVPSRRVLCIRKCTEVDVTFRFITGFPRPSSCAVQIYKHEKSGSLILYIGYGLIFICCRYYRLLNIQIHC